MRVFGGVALGRGLGHEGGVFLNGIGALMRKAGELACTLCCMEGEKKLTVYNLDKCGHQSSTMLVHQTVLLVSRTVRITTTVCCMSDPIDGILSWQPELT